MSIVCDVDCMSDEIQEDEVINTEAKKSDDVLVLPVVMPFILPHPMYIPNPDPVRDHAPMVYFN